MIDASTITASLYGAPDRLDDYLTALEWTLGRLKDTPRHLLPPPEGDDGERTLTRLAKRAVSAGPRAYQHIRDGVIGDVNWGGDDPELDENLERLDLPALAERLFERAAVNGLIAGIVATPDDSPPTIRRLGGFVEPITDPFDYDVVKGVAQVNRERAQSGQSKYRVRVYDLTSSTLREWVTHDFSALAGDGNPQAVEYLPRFAVLQVGPDGYPIGDMQRVLPLIQSEWASQVRGDRVEEATGFPRAVVTGGVIDPTSKEGGLTTHGTTSIIVLEADADFKYVIPGDLRPMHAHHDRKLERLREDLRLPGGSLGTQTPSGEALRESATKFVQMTTRYATAIENVMTALVSDYARATGSAPVPVVVDINREYEKVAKVKSVIELYEARLIPHASAVREIHPFVPSMTSREVEEFILFVNSPLDASEMLPAVSDES